MHRKTVTGQRFMATVLTEDHLHLVPSEGVESLCKM